MKRPLLTVAACFGLGFGCAGLAIAEPAGDLYVLGITINQVGSVGGWAQVGRRGDWQATAAGAILDGKLYTIETDGKLWRTDLSDGTYALVGAEAMPFGATDKLFAAEGALYSIDHAGTLYRVDPSNGGVTRVGDEAQWKDAVTGVVLKDDLFTITDDGNLWRTDLPAGERQQVGKAGDGVGGEGGEGGGGVRSLFAAGDALYELDADGSLYEVDPDSGTRTEVGNKGQWQQTIAGAIHDGRLYTAEKGGSLRWTDVGTGLTTTIGGLAFANTKFAFSADQYVYTIEADGSLYRITVDNSMLNSYNWCSEEIEQVFRDQGSANYNTLYSRHIQGENATRQEMLDGLKWLEDHATAEDTVVMFIDSHGGTNQQKGWFIVAADNKQFWGDELKAELAKVRCPVLLFIETCESGGFVDSPAEEAPMPANVTAITACRWNQNTDNQLSMAAAEALYGRADLNDDDVVDVDELCRYVEARYKEWWPEAVSGARTSQSPMIARSASLPSDRELTRASDKLAAVLTPRGFVSAVVEGQEADTYTVHYLGFSQRPGEMYYIPRSVKADALCLESRGRPVAVNKNGRWLPAELLKQEGGSCTVRLLGQAAEETVTADQVQHLFVSGGAADNGPGEATSAN